MTKLTSAAVTAAAIVAIFGGLYLGINTEQRDNRSLLDVANQAILNLDDKCSAVLVDDVKNLIVTASHCVKANDEHVPLYLSVYEDGAVKERKLFFGKVVKYDKVHDLAILQATAPDFPDGTAVRVADETPAVGETVYAIGNPLMLPVFVSKGIVSKIWEFPGDSQNYIMSDVKADHGSSGGALLNEDNELVGVTVAGLGITIQGTLWASDQWSMSTDVRYLRKLLKDIDEYRL